MNPKVPVAESVSNAMEMEIVSIGQMVIIPANVEMVVRDVFMAPARIIIKPVREPKPVANAIPIPVSIVPTMVRIAITMEFVIADPCKDQFGAVLIGNVLVPVNMMIPVRFLATAKEPTPKLFYLLLLKQGIQARP